MPSDHFPVAAQPTIAALEIDRHDSISALYVTNAQRLSGEIVTPSGRGEPGTSAVATILSLGMGTTDRCRRVATSNTRTFAFTGSVITARCPFAEMAMRYGSPKPRIVSIAAPLRVSTTSTTLSRLLPTHAELPSGAIAIPSGCGATLITPVPRRLQREHADRSVGDVRCHDAITVCRDAEHVRRTAVRRNRAPTAPVRKSMISTALLASDVTTSSCRREETRRAVAGIRASRSCAPPRRRDVDHRDRVARFSADAVVRHDRPASVVRRRDFVRPLAGRERRRARDRWRRRSPSPCCRSCC